MDSKNLASGDGPAKTGATTYREIPIPAVEMDAHDMYIEGLVIGAPGPRSGGSGGSGSHSKSSPKRKRKPRKYVEPDEQIASDNRFRVYGLSPGVHEFFSTQVNLKARLVALRRFLKTYKAENVYRFRKGPKAKGGRDLMVGGLTDAETRMLRVKPGLARQILTDYARATPEQRAWIDNRDAVHSKGTLPVTLKE